MPFRSSSTGPSSVARAGPPAQVRPRWRRRLPRTAQRCGFGWTVAALGLVIVAAIALFFVLAFGDFGASGG